MGDNCNLLLIQVKIFLRYMRKRVVEISLNKFSYRLFSLLSLLADTLLAYCDVEYGRSHSSSYTNVKNF
ncbi:hypothetical protein DSUL_50016 [Desulfovibrionales bacterium]